MIADMIAMLILQDEASSRDWRNSILYSLQHYVIKMRRSSRIDDLHRGIGVASYAKAFQGTCLVANGSEDPHLSVFQYDAVVGSIKARIDELDTAFKYRSQFKSWAISKQASYRGALISIYVVTVSVTLSFLQPYIAKHPEISDAVADFVTHFLHLIIILAIGLFVFSWVLLSEAKFNESHRRTYYKGNFI